MKPKGYNERINRKIDQTENIMNKGKLFISAVVFLYVAACITGCEKKDEKIFGPTITFANDIKETKANAYTVDVSITSKGGLTKVKVEKLLLFQPEANELIDEVTEFADPKKYSFRQPISVTDWTIIRFTATDKTGESINSFTFEVFK